MTNYSSATATRFPVGVPGDIDAKPFRKKTTLAYLIDDRAHFTGQLATLAKGYRSKRVCLQHNYTTFHALSHLATAARL
jgi:hypothetical protein